VDATVIVERVAADVERWRSSLFMRAEREIGQGVWLRGQVSEGRWASRARGAKGVRALGRD
jgi:hypothetical protein